MVEICLVCVFALLTISLVVDTQRKLKKREKVKNIILDNIKLKSDNLSMDDIVNTIRKSNIKINYDCLK